MTCHQTEDSIPHKNLLKVDNLKETIACRFSLRVKYIVIKIQMKAQLSMTWLKENGVLLCIRK